MQTYQDIFAICGLKNAAPARRHPPTLSAILSCDSRLRRVRSPLSYFPSAVLDTPQLVPGRAVENLSIGFLGHGILVHQCLQRHAMQVFRIVTNEPAWKIGYEGPREGVVQAAAESSKPPGTLARCNHASQPRSHPKNIFVKQQVFLFDGSQFRKQLGRETSKHVESQSGCSPPLPYALLAHTGRTNDIKRASSILCTATVHHK